MIMAVANVVQILGLLSVLSIQILHMYERLWKLKLCKLASFLPVKYNF